MVTGSTGGSVRLGIAILASISKLVACEVTISGTPEKIHVVGTAELASVPRLVAIEGVLWETSEVVLGTVGLDSAGWVTKETVDSDSCRDSVRVEKIILVSVPELMISEVTIAGMLGEPVITGVAEMASALGMVAAEDVVSNSLGEKFRVVLETGVLVSVEWRHEVVASG